MKLHKTLSVIILLMAPFLFYGQAETVFNGIQLNESLETATEKLSKIAKSVRIISVEKPKFPLAKTKEEHLICTQLKTENGIIGRTYSHLPMLSLAI